MRYRKSSNELCFTFGEFRSMSAAELCRYYDWGDEWVDDLRNDKAEKEIERGTATTV